MGRIDCRAPGRRDAGLLVPRRLASLFGGIDAVPDGIGKSLFYYVNPVSRIAS